MSTSLRSATTQSSCLRRVSREGSEAEGLPRSTRAEVTADSSKYSVAEVRMHARDGFGGVECSGAWDDVVRRERGLSSVGDRFLRQRMRLGLERRLAFEREVHALVRLDEDGDLRVGTYRWRALVGGPRAERDEAGIREAGGVSLPFAKSGDVVRFPGHSRFHVVSECAMPGHGPHGLGFVGKTAWIAWALFVLLGVNTVAGLVGVPAYEHFAHRPLRFDERFIDIQFILLALIGLVFLIYRKNVRYVYRGTKRK
jgi:hypothetical protein